MSARGDGRGAGAHGDLTALGLPPDATVDDARAVQAKLDALLRTAPDELKPWAEKQAAMADGVVRRLAEPDAPAEDPGPLVRDAEDDTPLLAGGAAKVRGAGRPPGKRRKVNPLLIAVVALGIIFGVYFLGGQQAAAPTAVTTPSNHPAIPTTPALDEARVAELKRKVAVNPADVASRRELGKLYASAGEFAQAASWQQTILDANPDDVDALLSLGVARFNADDTASAEKHWLRAAELKPGEALAHFNLGFLYLSKQPADMAKAQEHWQRVVQIDPNSDMAKTVSAHLQRLKSPSPSPTPSK